MFVLQRLYGSAIHWRTHDIDRMAKHWGWTKDDLAAVEINRDGVGYQVDAPSLARSSETIADVFNFVCSSARRDSYGDSIRQDTWVLDRHRSNPVGLAFHNGRTLPIGTWRNTRVENGKLKSSLTFHSDHFAQRMAKMVKDRVLVATSVGFIPGEWEFSKDKKYPHGIDFIRGHELCEISVVNVGACPDALLESTTTAAKASLSELRAKAVALLTPEDRAHREKMDRIYARAAELGIKL